MIMHTSMIRLSMLTVLLLSLSGCINISAQLQPINESVKAEKTSSDCADIIFGFGFGSLSVEHAMTKVQSIQDPLHPYREPIWERVPYITKIRSIELQDWRFLFFGERCINVTGE